jgi:hypothetical protein
MKKMKAARSKLRTDMTASINRQASKCVPTQKVTKPEFHLERGFYAQSAERR